MDKIICWLKEIWRSIPQLINGNYPISGHLFIDDKSLNAEELDKWSRL